MAGESEIPEDRCGFELVADMEDYVEAVSHPRREGVTGSFSKEALESWHTQTRAVCCWRVTWQDTGQCVWHAEIEDKPIEELKAARADGPERLDGAFLAGVNADTDISFQGCQLMAAIFSDSVFSFASFSETDLNFADFRNAHLFSANFNDAVLFGTDFRNAYLTGAEFHDTLLHNAEFHDAELYDVEFHDAILRGAEFHDADLSNADCTGADASTTDFTYGTLHDAIFVRADCRSATFTNALLYEIVFADTRINSQTTFYDSSKPRPAVIYEENQRTSKDLPKGIHPLEAAEWVYRRLEKLHDENALSEDARNFHISKEEARRAHQWEQGEYATYFVSSLQWHLSRHGESLAQILKSSMGLILVCGVLYPFAGGFESSSNDMAYRLQPSLTRFSWDAALDGIATLIHSIYFSVITFTTIGYGDLYPTGAGSKLLVGFESLSGAILIALFVFVLGRRVAR